MAERPIPIEFAPIKQAYLRHLETGEPPNLRDLVEQTRGTRLQRFFLDLVSSTYLETGRVGIHPDFPNLKEEMDSAWKMISSIVELLPAGFKPRLRVVKTDPEKPKIE